MKKATWKKLFSRSKSRSATRAIKRGKTANEPSGAGSSSVAVEPPAHMTDSSPASAKDLSGSKPRTDVVSNANRGPTIKETALSSSTSPNVPLVRTSTNEDFMIDEVESQNFSENSRTEEKPASRGELNEEPHTVLETNSGPVPDLDATLVVEREPEAEVVLEREPGSTLVLQVEPAAVPVPKSLSESELTLEMKPEGVEASETEPLSEESFVPEPALEEIIVAEPVLDEAIDIEPEPAPEDALEHVPVSVSEDAVESGPEEELAHKMDHPAVELPHERESTPTTVAAAAVITAGPEIEMSDEEANIVAAKNRRNALESIELSREFVVGVGSESGMNQSVGSPIPIVGQENEVQNSSDATSSSESFAQNIALGSVIRESNVLIVSGQEMEEEVEEDEDESMEEQALPDGVSASAEDLEHPPPVFLDGQPVLVCQKALGADSGFEDFDENEALQTTTIVTSEGSEFQASTTPEALSDPGVGAESQVPIYYGTSSPLPAAITVIGLVRDGYQEAVATEISNGTNGRNLRGTTEDENQQPQVSESEENFRQTD